ncbi:MAG: homoserine dehydrogenase [bacterium]
MKKVVSLGLIGFGTIGSGVVKLLEQNKKIIEKRTGQEIILKKIVDKDISSSRGININKKLLSTKADDILLDPEIDIVIELIGGINPAKNYILKALEQGKSIVTANKALLSEHGLDIFKTAFLKKKEIGFEASVAGGIPIIKILQESLVGNKIETIWGILNGTCNYILTQMKEKEKSFKEALLEAQSQGFAEKNPYLDIEGIDTAHKISILSMIAFGTNIPFNKIYTEGISEITFNDLQNIDELGFSLKLLAIAKNYEEKLDIRVHPTLIPKTSALAKINGTFNGICIKGDAVGEMMFYGLGAGSLPTASAVISDIVNISSRKGLISPLIEETSKIIDIQEISTKYYLRFITEDKPGVLSQIANILGQNNISISSVIQKEKHQKNKVPIIMMLYEAKEKNLRIALELIDKLPAIKEKTLKIRVEKNL